MPAAATDKFIKVAPNTGWQLDASGISDASVTTFGLVSATSLPTDTAVILTIDRVNSSGVATPSLMERVVGVMSGTNVTSCVRGLEGTAQAHAAGAVVEIVISKSNINKLMEGILFEHNQDGSHNLSDSSKASIYAGIKPAEGVMLNGKISVTDTGSGVNVALKTLAGSDATVSNPIYVTINSAVRTITAALSVTIADGTNWFSSGSPGLAGRLIDYFVYLGYNATDGVVIGFSRYPGATQYSEFSTTQTHEKYCAISNIANAASGDYYTIIARFSAFLSAGAGYNWSVPIFTATNLIQKPIYETGELTWLPTYTGFSAITTTGTYRLIRNRMIVMPFIPSGTSNAATFQYTLPFSSLTQELHACLAIDNGVGGTAPGRVYTSIGSSNVICGKALNADGGFTASGTKSIYQPTFNVFI